MGIKKGKCALAVLMALCMILQPFGAGFFTIRAKAEGGVVIDAAAYGADPTGVTDSTRAIQEAFAAAKKATEDGASSVTVNFPKGEYHIYKDYAEKREYHTSNTNSIQSPEKTIGLLVEGQENFTLEGNGSLFMMHGNMMALAVVESENVTLHDFSWDFAVPTVSEMTVTDMGTEGGKPYTDFFIPKCCPFEITGNTIQWNSEPSPYTGEYYWTETGIHNAYSVVGYRPDEEMTRSYYTSESPFAGVSGIEKLDDTTVRITYDSARPSMQKKGMILELASSAYRETAGAFTWESKNVTARKVNVHFMHGFGWLIQMSTDVYYYDCNMMPRENSGHVTVGYADGIHASGAAGDLVIENCNFSNTHDDPINLHGTFTRVEQRKDDHTLQLKYIHAQQGGFPQFHVGDEVAFFTRDTLESTDNETLYTVAEVISNPGEKGNDLRTMEVRFEEALPSNLTDKIGSEPKYVAENITYAPKVTIRNCTFKYVPTRGILCTTRNKVLIENNTFLNMSMATVYLSNDSDQWYESGPIRDMTIRNNTFYIKNIGRTSWEYAPAVYVHPVTKGSKLPSEDNPVHKNITIEGNTFHMDVDTVVKAESVENLTIRDNTILRTNPDVSIQVTAGKTSLNPGEGTSLSAQATGDTHTQAVDNVYEFTKCKNVVLEGNTYDDGLKRYAVLSDMSLSNLTNKDPDIKVASDRNQPVTDPVRNIRYASSNPDVASVNAKGEVTALQEGTAAVFAYYCWNDTIIRSNQVELTVGTGGAQDGTTVSMKGEDNVRLTQVGETHTFEAEVLPQGTPVWSVEDFETNGATDVAQIDENGVLTAKKNGIVWVKASVGRNTDKKAVIISLPKAEGLNPDFTVKREDSANYSLLEGQVAIDLQAGDLYNENNTVKNLFLYQMPDGLSKDQVRTVVKVENMPVKEQGQWDTASFLLYKDDDNYISLGKKSHFDGIARVEEKNGSAVEQNGNSADNQVADAYLGFCRQGGEVSLDYKLEGGSWQHLYTYTDAAAVLGDDYQIGFTGWETNDRGKKVTFSQFCVGDAALSYDEICGQTPIKFSGVENRAPSASDAAFEAESYQVGDEASVTYLYADPEEDAEGRTLYRFSYEDGALEEVTASSHNFLKRSGAVICYIYPVDKKGTPGVPQSISTQVQASGQAQDLESLSLNGILLYENGQEEREFNVDLPSELDSAQLDYRVLGGVGQVELLINGEAFGEAGQGSDTLTVPVKDQDVIQVKLSKDSVYTIHIRMVGDNDTQIDKIELDGLSFIQEQPADKSWFISTDSDKGQAELKITGNDRIGGIRLLDGVYRREVELKKEGNLYTAPLEFENGMNSYYIQVTAKDGITTAQHMLHINYAASTEAGLSMIRIDGKDLEGFLAEQKDYLVQLSEGASSIEVQAVKTTADRVRIVINGIVTEGTEAAAQSLETGLNEILIITTARDGISQNVYKIGAVLPDETSAELYEVKVNGDSIMDRLEGEEAALAVSENKAEIQITAMDNRAKITLTAGEEVFTGTGSLTQSVQLYREAPEVRLEVTAKDGTTKKSKTLKFEKAAYLSDIAYNEGATVGYGSIMIDKASSGSKIQLADDGGAAVTYEKGIGTHANSVITYNLSGSEFTKLQGTAGVDYTQYSSQNAKVRFTVVTDGKTAFDSGIMRGSTPGKDFEVDLTGVSELVLKAVQESNNWDAHSNWANMKLTAEFPSSHEAPTYGQTMVQSAHGTITSSVDGRITEGESVTYTFTPEQGYKVKKAMVNGQEVELTNAGYTVENVRGDVSVTAEFEAMYDTKALDAAIKEAKAVDLTGKTEAKVKAFQAVIKEAEDLLKKAVQGDAAVTQAQIAQMTDKVETAIEEVKKPVATYGQTMVQSAHGTITSSVDGRITEGESVTYTFTPEQGYKVKKAMVNGQEVGLTNAGYTVENVRGDVSVTAEFEAMYDTKALDAAIKEAKAVDLTGKTEAKVKAFQAVIKEAEDLLKKAVQGDAAVTQTQIAQMTDKVRKAVEEVKKLVPPVPVQEYTVSFAAGAKVSGTAPKSIKGAKGKTLTLPANPFARSGFRFTGWSDGTKVYQPGNTYVIQAKNTTITAVWTQVPGRVTGLSVKKSSTSRVSLSWKKAGRAAGYAVQRTVKGKNNWKTKNVSGVSSLDKKLAAGTAYTYRVRAYVKANGQTVYGSWSSQRTAVTNPLKPNLKVKAKRGYIQLSWQKRTGADKFEIWRKTGNGKFTRVKLARGSAVKYKMRAKKGTSYTFRIRGKKKVSGKKYVYSSYSKKIRITAK